MFFLRHVNQRRPMTGMIVSGDQCDHAAGDNLSCLDTTVLTSHWSSANYHLWCPVSPDVLLIVIMNNDYAEIIMQ